MVAQTSEIKSLLETVVDGGYCVGCGACAAVKDSPIQMHLNDYGMFEPKIKDSKNPNLLLTKDMPVEQVCPFSNQSSNEDEISSALFSQICSYNDKIGYYQSTYAGYVTQGGFRNQGSSGGMGTWLISKLLEENYVDSVIHVHSQNPTDKDNRLFKYEISTTLDEISKGSKSRYYPVELSEVIQKIRDNPGRYAIVGIPCFIKSIRLLIQQDPILKSRIFFCVGLVCGHLKTTKFADMFAWQCGIEPGRLTKIDFRKKLPELSADRYGIEVSGIENNKTVTKVKPTAELYGRVWGLGFFKYKACDYCDDVIAETADVVVGDAWLPQYVNDSRGTNIVVVRNPIIQEIINAGLSKSEIHLDEITVNDVIKSQESGLKHRREGLSYRLFWTDKQGIWRPKKRVTPASDHISKKLQKRYLLRMSLAKESHKAFRQAVAERDFSYFVSSMNPLLSDYAMTYPTSSRRKVKYWVKKMLKKVGVMK